MGRSIICAHHSNVDMDLAVKQVIDVKGARYDLAVISSKALCLRTDCKLSTHCSTAAQQYVIECSSGYTATISFDGKVYLTKDNNPVPAYIGAGARKPITLVECLQKLTASALQHKPAQNQTSIDLVARKTTVLGKAIIDLLAGESDLIACQTSELSVMDQLLIEALSHSHDVRYSEGANTAIMISRPINKPDSVTAQCHPVKMLG